ncbi:hypothetical protein LB542_27180 [Mesorhizobium sp. BR1-1-9]|uniref:hypothetical protein n=1 Tax=Mesorhizobium sp. BR1-1-9 TaxID=2876646 RepID=UPI001CD0F321|nr:hypothetical protein [Mesorhizobium sp. BR1-1-9]MBZ9874524.1 hypothetical protein [Mesorhizobium sp. BR1-1-9]
MLEDNSRLTVGDTIVHIMPSGCLPLGDDDNSEDLSDHNGPWRDPPVFPTDLFVAVAHLIHVSGLITYFDPNPDTVPNNKDRPQCFTLSMHDRESAKEAGARWAEDFITTPKFVYKLWDDLVRAWGDRIRASWYLQDTRRKLPAWWKSAIQLIIIADEACVGLGAPPDSQHPARWLVDIFQAIQAKPFARTKKLAGGAYRARRQPTSFGVDSDPDVACVQPKSRITSVGCGLRNLTKHVAYIPHVGNMRCHWHQPIESDLREDGDTLDILIIPFPAHIEESWFRRNGDAQPDPEKRPDWGNFHIAQEWLANENEVVEVVAAQISKAVETLGNESLNGLILPEFALTEPLFNQVCNRAKEIAPGLEFAVTGSSSNCENETGNFVLTAIWKNNPSGRLSEKERRYLLTSRRKHHRWKLSTSQIDDYDLRRAFPQKNASWWESHRIAQREIHFFHFRQTSVFTTMICEDLARSDPCHDILRSIGPNLLFALLMDGPQLKERWPARYAATLADDPGTSVLTVTSMGLVERTYGKYGENPVVALWKDETGDTKPLRLADGASSLLLRLEAKRTDDQTMDGRRSQNTWSWRYREVLGL